MYHVLFLVVFQIGFGNTNAIIRGQRLFSVEYPFVVHLSMVFTEHDERGVIENHRIACGGSIITRKTILTAAHCIDNGITEPEVSVHAGVVRVADFGVKGQTRKMETFDIHPDYNDNDDIDVALVHLKEKFILERGLVEVGQFVNVKVTREVTIVGWGLMEFNRRTDTLRRTPMNIIRSKRCYDSYADSNNFLCMMHPMRLCSVCFGDSGGPMIYKNKIAGVIAMGSDWSTMDAFGNPINTCSTILPAVAMNVNPLKKWIKNNS